MGPAAQFGRTGLVNEISKRTEALSRTVRDGQRWEEQRIHGALAVGVGAHQSPRIIPRNGVHRSDQPSLLVDMVEMLHDRDREPDSAR